MEAIEKIKTVNKIQVVKKCAADTKRVVNALLAELTDYVEIQAELWSRGWYEVKSIEDIYECPVIKAQMVLEDDLEYGNIKRMTYNVEIRQDCCENFTYKVEMVSCAKYYMNNGLVVSVKEIDGLN